MSKNVRCETVMNPLTATAAKELPANSDHIVNCPKQAVKLVNCWMGATCMFYPRKHKHALCLEHFDTYADWKKTQ